MTGIISLIGLFIIIASITDWDFFFQYHTVKPFVEAHGRKKVRNYCLVIGFLILILGLFLNMGDTAVPH